MPSVPPKQVGDPNPSGREQHPWAMIGWGLPAHCCHGMVIKCRPNQSPPSHMAFCPEKSWALSPAPRITDPKEGGRSPTLVLGSSFDRKLSALVAAGWVCQKVEHPRELFSTHRVRWLGGGGGGGKPHQRNLAESSRPSAPHVAGNMPTLLPHPPQLLPQAGPLGQRLSLTPTCLG